LKFTLSPVISLFIQTAGNRLLSLSDDIHRRVFFFLDEFGQLPNMATIENLMTASRSKGGAVFIGVQDIGQLDKLYKKETRTTILNSASNRIVFNCKDHDTAKFFSDDIGKVEFYENMESQSLGMNKGDRINTNRQLRTENLVMTEDIQSLPDLHAFVSIGHHDITLSKWKYKKFKKQQVAFVPREDLDLANLKDVNPLEFLKLGTADAGSEITEVGLISDADLPKPKKKATAKPTTGKAKKPGKSTAKDTNDSNSNDDDSGSGDDDLNSFFEDNMQG
jgi:type IV secretory pathway TraG/TraD family ATPase VirD4